MEKDFDEILKTEYSNRFDEIRKKTNDNVFLQVWRIKRQLSEIQVYEST